MVTYQKIETPFNRAMDGTKKLIEGDWLNSTVAYISGLPWGWTEKIDGTNTRIYWDGHRVTYGGRTESASLPAPLVNKLNEIFGTYEAEEMFEQKFGETEVMLFGEGYGGRIQKAGPLYGDLNFRLFDVYFPTIDLYLRWNDVQDVAKSFGVETVPWIGMGTLQEAIDFVKTKPKSTIADAPMEGVVCKPLCELRDRQNKRLIVKIKVKDFT